MREIRTSGLMSGDGKRGFATAPILDSTVAAALPHQLQAAAPTKQAGGAIAFRVDRHRKSHENGWDEPYKARGLRTVCGGWR
jgi:hypothetical protein